MAQIKIYSTTTCPYCHLEMEYLDSKGQKYEYILVDKDQAKLEEMVKLSGTYAVPFTHIIKEDGSEEKILGFDQPRLAEALSLK
jgi:glutaredoxin 3